ncbi:hypothetical protein KVR01_011053 [Diaporthe batatas]|uniref:uncharacterized protein n=1 Tax=Diaporthe batatas TaxID=748121 RepID=UPI001D037664|nr:uncharacterized protein KVR01_011053 [Diaporthe batatas]KAG8159392.1 hypothetical protein KVR01_011053 [Diaporthe batatas]
MFEVPNAKRVRRDQLYGSSSDGGDQDEQGVEDAEERAKLNARLSSLLGLDLSAPAPSLAPGQGPDAADAHGHGHGGTEDQEERHDEEFEFRLFSGPTGTSAPAKVVLDASDDEDAPKGGGGFVRPERPQSYYLAGEATPDQRERYCYAAVTAEDIIAGASKRAWGLERPWRVVKISLSSRKARSNTAGSDAGATATSEDNTEDGAKRKRPGKKRRIAVRIKARAEKEKREAEKARREAAEKQRISKEEHLLEKKKRLNREKKLKRRAKEKEKKLAAGETLPPSEAPTSPRSE